MSLPLPVRPTSGSVAVIGPSQLRRLVSMADAIETSRRAFLADVRGEVSSPLRSSISRGRVLVMPAEHLSGSAVLKVISVPDQEGDGRSSIGGVALWLDAEAGHITAIVDGASLTALRTGAASGLATELLARPESSVLAMIGSGGQARAQVAAVCAVRPIREVRIHSRNLSHSQELCRQLTAEDGSVRYRPVPSATEAVSGADVICTATRATEPLFAATDLSADVHINAVGSFRPDMGELPVEVFARARLVVIDQFQAALEEAGDLLAALRAGAIEQRALVELGQLLGREDRRRGGLTVFKSVGIAAQDWALMELLVSRARAAGLVPVFDATVPPLPGGLGPPPTPW